MHVLGIDLAASPASTGAVVLRPGDRWTAEVITGPLDDDRLVEVARDAVAVGVDAPLGWPDAFVESVSAHHRDEPWPAGPDRSGLTHRVTDHATRPHLGRLPLSVSADLLGVVALRCALLQRRWGDEVWGGPAPRDGSGVLAETYPAAALAVWGVAARGYKARRNPDEARRVRTGVVATIAADTAGWLALDDVAAASIDSDHVLDALVCALVVMEVRAGFTHHPPPESTGAARREGWIHVPSRPLAALRPQ